MSEGYEMYEGIVSTVDDLIDDYQRQLQHSTYVVDKCRAEGALQALRRLLDILDE